MRQGITDTVKHLLIINVIMFIGTYALKNQDLFLSLFALYFPKSDLFQPWQIITHMFMHGNLMHILFNMLALWMFGTAVEQVFGKKKFIFLYFSAGLGAVLLTFIVYYIQVTPLLSQVSELGYPPELINKIINLDIVSDGLYQGKILGAKMEPLLAEYNVNAELLNQETFRAFFDLNVKTNGSMVGASGAIMGVLVAFGMLFPESKLMLIFLPIPIKAKYFIPGIIILDFISATTGQSFFSPSNTAYVAHLGGALTGFIIMWFWRKNSMNKYRWN
ncbi:rhomboid family intramembrane serine protease [Winogradskyella sp. 3972H.M.0a.05]|uniref:rhomboid family intramembrane serine protease n=1 Tax=Winogradskyella sp. 3972H.M.0a.05 TaxID=2950277 RepID=UPI00339794C5